MQRGVWVAAALAILAILNVMAPTPRPKAPPVYRGEADGGIRVRVDQLDFAEIDDWDRHDPSAGLAAMARSCEKMSGLRPVAASASLTDRLAAPSAWRDTCAAIRDLAAAPLRASLLRFALEYHFVPVQLTVTHLPDEGPVLSGNKTHAINEPRFTGYFEPVYEARRQADDLYAAPALTRPDDLVMVDLGAFRSSLAGQRIAGRVTDGRLLPYADHKGLIESPPETSDVLGYMDPNDLLTLQIQGSGVLRFLDGEELRVGYAAQNGHPYYAIGRALIEEGHIPREKMSMQAIRDWLADASPEEAARIRYTNPSYVFFTALDSLPAADLGPLGAQGVQLTPMRSVAIDPRFYPYGLPVWIEVDSAGAKFASLFVAQDTGGAIRGAQRADLFFGRGRIAGEKAGSLNDGGRLVAFVPAQIVASLKEDDAPQGR